MLEILHIFKKDVRHQAPQIAALLILVAMYAWSLTRPGRGEMALRVVLPALLPFGWWYLIAVAVHEEALPGEGQYWLTRPFSRGELLAAKLLFVFTVVIVPVTLAQTVILLVNGLSFSPADLFWKQVSMSAILVMPGLILAAITRGMKEVVLFSLAAAIAVLVFFGILGRPWVLYGAQFDSVEWIRLALIALTLFLAGALILFLQYSGRRTIISAATAVAALVVCGLLETSFGVSQMFSLQAALPGQRVDGRSVSLSFDSNDPWKVTPIDPYRSPQNFVHIELPIHVDGLPAGTELSFDRTAMTINGRNAWHSGPDPFVHKEEGAYYQTLTLPLASVQSRSARIHFEADLTLFDRATVARIPIGLEPALVPDVGRCALREWPVDASPPNDVTVYCLSAFRFPNRTKVQLEDRLTGERRSSLSVIGSESYAPVPMEPGIDPLTKAIAYPAHVAPSLLEAKLPNTDFVFSTQRPLAHLRRAFDASGVRLMNYVH